MYPAGLSKDKKRAVRRKAIICNFTSITTTLLTPGGQKNLLAILSNKGGLYISEIHLKNSRWWDSFQKRDHIPVQYFEMNSPPDDIFRKIWTGETAYFET